MKSNIRDFLITHLKNHPQDIVTFSAKKLSVSRQAVHKALRQLIESGEVIKTGVKKSSCYYLNQGSSIKFHIKNIKNLTEETVWNKYLEGICSKFPKNAYQTLHYGFTEMLNNAIDHAQSKSIDIEFKLNGNIASFLISDKGIGIFQKIKKAFNLGSFEDAVLQLTKGRLTTDPSRHSGEGLFFTSRVMKYFELTANSITFVRFGDLDWSIKKTKVKNKGTTVFFEFDINSKNSLKSIFEKYTDDDFGFTKTVVHINLVEKAGKNLVSRSQAKRVVAGLDSFSKIIFDFKDVEFVGQGFVDEVFRVFQNQYPDKKLEWINTNEDVRFMILRGLKS